MNLTSSLLRVAEEALDKVQRHAVARSIAMHATFDGATISLEVSDDGIGLFRARELLAHAGGTMQIVSFAGSGTRILATGSVLEAGPK